MWCDLFLKLAISVEMPAFHNEKVTTFAVSKLHERMFVEWWIVYTMPTDFALISKTFLKTQEHVFRFKGLFSFSLLYLPVSKEPELFEPRNLPHTLGVFHGLV